MLCRKKNFLITAFFICAIYVHSQQSVDTEDTGKDLYTYMFDRGYTLFNVNWHHALWKNACSEILGENYRYRDGTSILYLKLSDGLHYSFYYTNSVKNIPNIMVTVVVDGEAFYKINKNLDGEIHTTIDADTGEEEKWLIFY
ncbi:MAG: hypothetical protein Ta2A_12840 [Treponemataceae bacterium]|nr:MAG: hypothetical protein Ta2A_12840 [Treponemataceae bacterium]